MKTKFISTELGELPEDWNVVRLGDYAYIKARIGWRALSSKEYTEKGPYLIAGNHIENGRVIWDRCQHITEERYDESHEIILNERDIIISKDGTIGRVAYIDSLPGKATINGTMMLIRIDEKSYDSRYVFQYFQSNSFKKLVKAKVSGSSIPHIFQRDMVEFKIVKMPITEQKKIAEVLTTMDEAIEMAAGKIRKTEQLKKGLMQRLLTKGIGHTKFKKTELGEIPEEWRIAELGDKNYFKIATGSTPVSTQKDYWEEGNINWATPKDLIGKYLGRTERRINKKGLKNSNVSLVNEGSIIVSTRAPIGLVAVAITEMTFNQGCKAIIIIDNEVIDSEYLYYMVLTRVHAMQKAGAGSTFMEISKENFEKIKVSIPSIIEQKKISKILKDIDVQVEFEVKRKERLEYLKNGLMNELLTGKKRRKI